MLFRLIVGAFVATLSVLGFVSPAAATGYGPSSGEASASATVVNSGGSVTVRGDGFCPNSTVTVTVSQGGETYYTGTTLADGQGDVEVRLRLTETGSNVIRLRGTGGDCDSSRVLGVRVNVRSAAAAGAQGPRNADAALAATGGTDFTPLWAGLGLLVAGSALVTVSRTRRRVTV